MGGFLNMGIWEILVGAFVLIFSVIMIIVIILQEGHDSGLGTITGGADSFLQRGKAKTADALFAKVTKYCAIAFFMLVVLLNALSYFGLTGKQKEDTKTPETSVVSEVSANGNDESSVEVSDTESVAAESSTESSAEVSEAESSEEVSAAESNAESSAEASNTESSEEASDAESSEESVAE